MDEIENNIAGKRVEDRDEPVSETEQLHLANRDLQDQVASMRRELESARASERLIRESRWWRLGLALRNRRNVLFALRHPIWALKTLVGLRTRRGRRGRGKGSSATTARQWLAGVSASPRVPEDLWIAGIFDDELGHALEPDCNLITFRPDNWQVNLEGRRPHMLLVESAERGNDGSWEYRIASTTHADAAGLQDLRELIDWCRANGTPTVFWFTSSIGSVARFSEAAALFDHVVATEANAAQRLQRSAELRAPTVLVVPAGVQPVIHSPIGAVPASDTCTILPPARKTETFEQLVGAAQTFGLTVYADAGGEGSEDGVTVVEPDALERVVARHALYVNGEATGLPVRALNAIASGAAVVTVPNPVLEEALGSAITVARTTEEAKEAIERLLSDEARRAAIWTAGLRSVLSGHTIRHRIAAIARAAGYEIDEGFDARVAALVLAQNGSEADAIARRIASQCRVAEICVGVIELGPPRKAADEEEGPLVRVIEQDASAGESARWRALAELVSSPWVVPLMRDGDASAVNDLMLAQRFAGADVLAPGDAFVFTDAFDPSGAVARRALVAARGWPPGPAWLREGVRLFTVPR